MEAKDNIRHSDESAQMELSPKIYPIDVVLSAAYSMMDRAYIIIDGDPGSRITVSLKPREGKATAQLAYAFNDELINYSVYKRQSEKNASLRELMLKRALLSNIDIEKTAELSTEDPGEDDKDRCFEKSREMPIPKEQDHRKDG